MDARKVVIVVGAAVLAHGTQIIEPPTALA
jgi:hypothetical protein